MARALPPVRLVFDTTKDVNSLTWTPILAKGIGVVLQDAAMLRRVRRVMFQNQGTGKVFLFPDGNASLGTTDGFVLDCRAPAAGPTYPVTFIDEVPCNHCGEWWAFADTSGIVLVVTVWVDDSGM
jgi:hypothetical protein